MGNLYGYARCSTNETLQDINRQTYELEQLGVVNDKEHMFFEYESGMKIERAEFQRLMNKVVEGDTIIATELTRITRSTKHLIEIIDIAKSKKLKLILGKFELDCSKDLDPMTEGMIKMMGVFAELERNMISQRVKSGMDNAKRKGKRIGRPNADYKLLPNTFKKLYPMYKNGEIKKIEFAKMVDVSRPTLDRYLKTMEEYEKEKESHN